MTNLEERYNEWLDEVYEPIVFGYLTFYPSDIIKNCDPIAYRCGMADFEDIVEKYND